MGDGFCLMMGLASRVLGGPGVAWGMGKESYPVSVLAKRKRVEAGVRRVTPGFGPTRGAEL